MSFTDFPNVPDVPGVPSLPRAPDAIISAVELLVTDIVSSLFGVNNFVWGVFLDGELVIEPDTIASFEYKQDWPISTYPVEQGAFQSYDKVQLPFDLRVRMATGGTDSDRQAFLDAVDAAANSLDLYDIVTPEVVYPSCNITHYDYQRTATNGLGLITVDLWFTQIRVTSTATFTNTQQPSGADSQGAGSVTPTAPSATNLEWLNNAQFSPSGSL